MTNTEHELTTVLVEDERMFSEMLARSLTSVSGLSLVARAFNVEQGVEACQKHAPDLLILDLALPDGNGIDVLKALKKFGQKPSLWSYRHMQMILSRHQRLNHKSVR
jgi:Response regulator of citrate/malate metabolism